MVKSGFLDPQLQAAAVRLGHSGPETLDGVMASYLLSWWSGR